MRVRTGKSAAGLEMHRFPPSSIIVVMTRGSSRYLVNACKVHGLARLIHDGAWRDGYAEPQETEAYLERYVEAARGKSARRRLVNDMFLA